MRTIWLTKGKDRGGGIRVPGSQRTYIDANVELYTSLQGRMDDMGIFLGTCCWWLVLRGTEKREARSKKRTDQLCKNYFYKKKIFLKKLGRGKRRTVADGIPKMDKKETVCGLHTAAKKLLELTCKRSNPLTRRYMA